LAELGLTFDGGEGEPEGVRAAWQLFMGLVGGLVLSIVLLKGLRNKVFISL
jgi:hypothetical protein